MTEATCYNCGDKSGYCMDLLEDESDQRLGQKHEILIFKCGRCGSKFRVVN